MRTRQLRALRGAIGAVVATLVGAAAHTLAGGGAPSPGVVVAVATLAWPFAVAIAGRAPALWRTGLTVLLTQLFLHVAFVLAAGADPSTMVGHAHHGAGALSDSATGVGMTGLLPEPPMLLGHALAAAATVLALTWGERMLRALGRGIRSLFTRVADVVAPVRPVLRAAAPQHVHARPTRVALSSLSRRGPPALVAAAR